MADLALAAGSTNVLELDELKDALTGTKISAATVTATVYNESLAAVSGATDLACAAVSGKPGRYRATVADTVVLPSPTALVAFTVVYGSVKRIVWIRADVSGAATV